MFRGLNWSINSLKSDFGAWQLYIQIIILLQDFGEPFDKQFGLLQGTHKDVH